MTKIHLIIKSDKIRWKQYVARIKKKIKIGHTIDDLRDLHFYVNT